MSAQILVQLNFKITYFLFSEISDIKFTKKKTFKNSHVSPLKIITLLKNKNKNPFKFKN